jgi:inorganic pyrophosphatase
MPHTRLRAYDRKRDAYVAVIEAVRDTRNKFKFDPKRQVFVHHGVLQAGASYPFDFGFIAGTRADDGDPLDILVLMDEPAFVGAVVPFRLIGAIEAEQREHGEDPERNDRLLGVACKSESYRDVREIDDLPSALLDQVEQFWVSKNEIKGRRFKVLGRANAKAAAKLVKAATNS